MGPRYSYEFVFEDGHNFDIQDVTRTDIETEVHALELDHQPIIAVIERELPPYEDIRWEELIGEGFDETD